jgi:GNAT superfamily N-acetyltransferase
MRLEDVSKATEGTFFRCLHDERPDDPEVVAVRRKWYEENRKRGLRAKVLVLDGGEVAALCQYLPIEHSHYIGEGLMAILCMWVHGYDHHIGNRQGNGYGRFMLEAVEEDARSSGFKGVAVWGKDFPYWNPVSFYEHMGYARVDQVGMDVLAWKPFTGDAKPPRLLRQVEKPVPDDGRVQVVSLYTGWCGGFGFNLLAREAVKGLDGIVDFVEVDTSNRENLMEWGISDGILLDGRPYRSDGPPFTAEELRAEIMEVHAGKTGD